MFCLNFKESGGDEKKFYFNHFRNAVNMQRELLIIEINNIIKSECGENPFDNDDLCKLNNMDLNKLLHVLIRLNYRDDYYENNILIAIEHIFFEDEPAVPINLID
jgi:hypothetical protein